MSIFSFRPSPFFILDEVDAPLDYQPLHKPSGDDKGDAAAAAEKGEGAAGHAPRGLPDDIARRVVKQVTSVPFLAFDCWHQLCNCISVPIVSNGWYESGVSSDKN